MAAVRHLGFLKIEIFEQLARKANMRAIAPNFVKVGQTVSQISRSNVFFQKGGRPPSWI